MHYFAGSVGLMCSPGMTWVAVRILGDGCIFVDHWIIGECTAFSVDGSPMAA